MGIKLESAARINALTAKANAVTGAADTQLAPAVERLIAGFGTGGGTGGGGTLPSASPKAVNFRDYDGTLLYSYTLEEAAALTELPALPTHEGLICQGWNYDLDTIKRYNRAVEVGAMYITDDGKTRIYITLQEGRTSPMLGVCPNGTVDVDWGDGTAHDTLTGTSVTTVKWTPTHEYASAGDYVILLTVDGEMRFYGVASLNQYASILRYSSGEDARNQVYQNAVQKAEIGDGVTSLGTASFSYCRSLASVSIPNSVTSIGNYAFYNCNSLVFVNIPDSVTSISDYMFNSCYALASVSIPNSVTSIGNTVFSSCSSLTSVIISDGVTSIGRGAFNSCSSLTSVVIPNGVTSIGNNAFFYCYGVRYYDFTHHTAVPTLSSASAFDNIAADCEIRVPAALADEWKATTNWATYADHIVGV